MLSHAGTSQLGPVPTYVVEVLGSVPDPAVIGDGCRIKARKTWVKSFHISNAIEKVKNFVKMKNYRKMVSWHA